MAKLTMTYIGKIKQSEGQHSHRKSSDFTQFSQKEHIKLMEKLIDIMEDDDDVQNIWHNWEE